jgi:hypothetical protein
MTRTTRNTTRNNGISPPSTVSRANERRQSNRLRDTSNATTNGVAVVDAEQYEDTMWEVERVVGKRYDEEGRAYYHLKWKEYDGEPSWEPKENCHCRDLIQDYESIIAKREREERRANEPTPGPSSVSSGPRTKTTPKRSSR